MLRGSKYDELSQTVKDAVQESVEQGGITTLIRDAKRSTLEGFDVELLDSLGVQRGPQLCGGDCPSHGRVR